MDWRCKQSCRRHTCLDRFNRSTCPGHHIFLPWSDAPEIETCLHQHDRTPKQKSAISVIANDLVTATDLPNPEQLRVPQQRVRLSRLESSVLVLSTAIGLRIIESKTPTGGRGREGIIIARGVAKLLSLVHFNVFVARFSTKPVYLP